jgi:hypothetical protein
MVVMVIIMVTAVVIALALDVIREASNGAIVILRKCNAVGFAMILHCMGAYVQVIMEFTKAVVILFRWGAYHVVLTRTGLSRSTCARCSGCGRQSHRCQSQCW